MPTPARQHPACSYFPSLINAALCLMQPQALARGVRPLTGPRPARGLQEPTERYGQPVPSEDNDQPSEAPSDIERQENVKHLELIQAIITRLASNSFFIKGWALTVAAATFGFDGVTFIIALAP